MPGKWGPMTDSPEMIQQCLHCEKSECINCYYTEKHSEDQKKRWEKFAERKKAERQAKKEREWRAIEKMLDAGIAARRIAQILGKSKNYFYDGRHATNYKVYRAERERERGKSSELDGETSKN